MEEDSGLAAGLHTQSVYTPGHVTLHSCMNNYRKKGKLIFCARVGFPKDQLEPVSLRM